MRDFGTLYCARSLFTSRFSARSRFCVAAALSIEVVTTPTKRDSITRALSSTKVTEKKTER